jgi:glutathione S-transferase
MPAMSPGKGPSAANPIEGSTMTILYGMPNACSLASHIALIWSGQPFELRLLSHAEEAGASFQRINPKACVPVLMTDAGEVLTESLAVLQYVALHNPDARLGADPADGFEQARMNECLAELVSDVHMAWAPVFVPERYVMHKAHEEEARQAAYGQLDKQYRRLDGVLAKIAVDAKPTWRLFKRRTVADAYLYVMCSWIDNTPTPLASYPALAAYKTWLDSDPGIQQALQVEIGDVQCAIP